MASSCSAAAATSKDDLTPSVHASEPVPFHSPTFVSGKRFTLPVNVPEEVDKLEDDSSDENDATKIGPAMLLRSDSMAGNVLVKIPAEEESPSKAYWIQRKIAKTTFGSVRVAYVLRPRVDASDSDESSSEDDDEATSGRKRLRKSTQWEVVPLESGSGYEMVGMKLLEKKKVESMRGRRSENPMVELSAMQMMGAQESDSHYVLGSLDTLEDERFIYNVMPYTGGGDLFHYIKKKGRVEEGVARHFFRQILKALQLFQEVGLCHRDLCLETILLRGSDCFVTGLSKCLQIPYRLPGSSSVTCRKFTTKGGVRCSITPQGQCGRPHTMPPEILTNKENFDGHSVDLWAAGIMLFHMIFGDRPFVWAVEDDPRFKSISLKAELASLAQKWSEEKGTEQGKVSIDALDLLQNMLVASPQDRLSLDQVLDHPWLSKGEDQLPSFLPKIFSVPTESNS